MKHEEKTLVMVSLENRDCDYKIVGGTVEANAYELYEKCHRDYDHHEENGDQIFTFSAIGEIPENDEEREALETASYEGKAAKVFDRWENDGEKYIYFKANFDDGEGPENFATKIIYVVFNGRQEYLTYNGTIPHPELGTVDTNVTINEKNYCLSIPAKFDEDGEPYRADDFGIVTDEGGKTYDLHDGDPFEDKVPNVPNNLWMDIAEEVVPNKA